MKKTYFSLNRAEPNKFVRIITILFGASCIIIAIFWLFFNMHSSNGKGALWITVVFLTGFGVYMLLSGFGLAKSYIEIGSDYILLKKNQLLGPIRISSSEIEKIESLPLNVIIYRKEKKRVLFRFGTSYYDTNSKIIDEILDFAQENSIPFEIIEEEL